MPYKAGGFGGSPTRIAAARGPGGSSARATRSAPPAAVSLVSRLLLAQAGACAAIGVGYSRRNLPWLLLTIGVALVVCGLAALVRSGGHGTWLTAITVESTLVAVGLFRFAYAGYVGGTLLAIVTLGTLLHPAVSGAFAAVPGAAASGGDDLGLADETVELDAGVASP
jgi:hypothetical protein